MKGLDAWITGNYGEDHPDNQQNWHAEEADRIARARREAEDRKLWAARRHWTNEEKGE
jgi:hypothetical protein